MPGSGIHQVSIGKFRPVQVIPPKSPFTKGGLLIPPFAKGGLGGIWVKLQIAEEIIYLHRSVNSGSGSATIMEFMRQHIIPIAWANNRRNPMGSRRREFYALGVRYILPGNKS